MVTPKPLNKFFARVACLFYGCLYRVLPKGPPSGIVGVLNRGASAPGSRRGRLRARRSRREMAPQRLEKIESAPGNGMGSEASNLLDLVHGRAADRTPLRLTSRENDEVAKVQKKAPNALN